MSEQDAALDLSEAEAALERGDYGQGLELLLPLAEQHLSLIHISEPTRPY